MNNKIALSLIFALIGTSLVAACAQGQGHGHGNGGGHGHGHGGPSYFKTFSGVETINGVAPATRQYWMNYAMQTRLNAQGPCPRDGFGAVIVNRTTNTLLCATSGLRSTFDPTDHAEIRIIRE